MKILSPLTSTDLTKILRTYESKKIIDSYSAIEVDVKRFFSTHDRFYEVLCLASNYRFFYPFTLAGDSLFYEELQKNSWYYNTWKWEHQQALQMVAPETKVLEIGCGTGMFLERARSQLSCKTVGIELNELASKTARLNGIDVRNCSLQSFADQHAETFDTVCSFHVLEHIVEVRPFIEDMIKCLKPNGQLIIAVPNNKSFLGLFPNYLNMPPHHMCLWEKTSLWNLENLFPIQLLNFHFEELQDYHKDMYYWTLHRIAVANLGNRIGIFARLVAKILRFAAPNILSTSTEKKLLKKLPTLKSFTIIAEFIKKVD